MNRKGLNYFINLQDGNFGRQMDKSIAQTRTMDSAAKNLGSTLATAFAAKITSDFARQATETSARLDGYRRVVQFASKDQETYTQNLQYATGIIKAYNLPMEESIQGYAQFTAALKNSSVEGEVGNKIFKSMAMAQAALHLPAEKSQRIFNALSQMISKGTVSSEELKQQIGESLPGAFNLAADAMGVTTKELNKMLDNGQVMAEDLLPKLADKMIQTYQVAAAGSVNSLTGKLNAANNAILAQTEALGAHLAPAHLALQHAQALTLEGVVKFIEFGQNHIVLTYALGGAVAGLTLAWVANKTAMYASIVAGRLQAAIATYQMVQTLGLASGVSVLTASYVALSRAMGLTPWGLAISAAALLVGAFVGLNQTTNDLALSTNAANEQQDLQSYKLEQSKFKANALFKSLTDLGRTESERQKTLKQINSEYAPYLSNLLKEKSSAKEIAAAHREVNAALNDKIDLLVKEELASKQAKRLADAQDNYIQAQINSQKLASSNSANTAFGVKDLNAGPRKIAAGLEASAKKEYEAIAATVSAGNALIGVNSTATNSANATVSKLKSTATGATTSGGVAVGNGSSRGNTYNITIQTLKGADTIVLENSSNLRGIESEVQRVLQRALADLSLLN